MQFLPLPHPIDASPGQKIRVIRFARPASGFDLVRSDDGAICRSTDL